jgi:hypothetical protein
MIIQDNFTAFWEVLTYEEIPLSILLIGTEM